MVDLEVRILRETNPSMGIMTDCIVLAENDAIYPLAFVTGTYHEGKATPDNPNAVAMILARVFYHAEHRKNGESIRVHFEGRVLDAHNLIGESLGYEQANPYRTIGELYMAAREAGIDLERMGLEDFNGAEDVLRALEQNDPFIPRIDPPPYLQA